MADFDVAFNWMMDAEDRSRKYAVVPDYPPGSHAISGINSSSFPGAYQAIAALPQSTRGPAIENFYRTSFWNQWFSQLTSDELAKRVFDMAVNGGPGTAVKLLQEAIGDCGQTVSIDGKWGPNTVAAANACTESEIVLAFKAARAQRYRDIVERNPAESGFLDAWLTRAAA